MIKAGDKYILLTFDTESDIGSWTQSYSSIDRALPMILDILREKEVKASFLWEGMAALHNPGMVQQVYDAGHETGCHSYKHETLGDPGYFIPGDRAILPEEIPNRINRTTAIIEIITGTSPVSFRAPRLWGNETMVRALDELGYLIDTTHAVANENDSLFPYHPHPQDLGKAGNMGILEVPVAGIFGEMINEASNNIKQFGIETTGGTESIGQWPILRLYGAKEFADFLQLFVEKQLETKGCSVVCVYLHPWEFIPMPGVIEGPEARAELARTLYENCGDYALKALAEFIDIFKKAGFTFITLKDFYSIWEEQNDK